MKGVVEVGRCDAGGEVVGGAFAGLVIGSAVGSASHVVESKSYRGLLDPASQSSPVNGFETPSKSFLLLNSGCRNMLLIMTLSTEGL